MRCSQPRLSETNFTNAEHETTTNVFLVCKQIRIVVVDKFERSIIMYVSVVMCVVHVL